VTDDAGTTTYSYQQIAGQYRVTQIMDSLGNKVNLHTTWPGI
jgi:hypothetical protein